MEDCEQSTELLNIYFLTFYWVPVLALLIYSNSVHTVPKCGTKPIRYATFYLRDQRGASLRCRCLEEMGASRLLVQERTRWRHAAHPFVSSARYFQAPATQANAAQLLSITEIAPPQPFLCVNRSPILFSANIAFSSHTRVAIFFCRTIFRSGPFAFVINTA